MGPEHRDPDGRLCPRCGNRVNVADVHEGVSFMLGRWVAEGAVCRACGWSGESHEAVVPSAAVNLQPGEAAPLRPHVFKNEHGLDTIRLDVQASTPIIGLPHTVMPPGVGTGMTEPHLYPYVWFGCQFPGRHVDVATRFDDQCGKCRENWAIRSALGEVPVSPLPPLPADAPRFREHGDGIDGRPKS